MRTVGVEEEFLVVDGPTPRLSPEGPAVVAVAASNSDGQFEQELKREQAELGSSPQESIDELRADLSTRRSQLAAAAQERGVRLLATGTSPIGQDATTTDKARYERMTQEFGRVARMQLTCGMHVHVSVASPDEGVGVLDRMRDWLAVLAALSANSPFHEGRDTDYASYRSVMWGQWPTAGIADVFGDVAGYEHARAALVSSGAALDDGMIYFDARLSAHYPTVEIRVADICIETEDAAVIAALARGLVSTAASSWAAGDPPSRARGELLRAASWRSARWGMAQQLVEVESARPVPAWSLVDRLLGLVGDELDATGDRELVTSGLEAIRRRGTGATQQRGAFDRGGLPAVLDAVEVHPRSEK